MFLHRNEALLTAVRDCRTLIQETMDAPTHCAQLVQGHPHYIGVKDASGHGVGGVILGESAACVPTVFRLQWPPDITANIKSDKNPNGQLTNSDLEMAGLLLLWLVMEVVCPDLERKHVALFSDNSPTVSWVKRLASRSSLVAAQLVRALALRLAKAKASPLTPLHIAGKRNAMTDIPSRSFGSEPQWFCTTDADLLRLFNKKFPLPEQRSWTVFRLTSEISTKVISVLRMQLSTLAEWRRLRTAGAHTGAIGAPMSHLWEWSLHFRVNPTPAGSEPSQASQLESERATTAEAARSQLQQSLRLSQPLARRSQWTRE